MRALAIALMLLSCTGLKADPRSHYMIHCMGCHLADGRGTPPDVPVFDASMIELLDSDKGRAYLIQVPGSAQSPINDEDLAAVLNWILTNYAGLSSHPDVTPITTDEVTRYRRDILLTPVEARAELSAKAN